MNQIRRAPYGTWNSSVTAGRITAGSVKLRDLFAQGQSVFWLEGRAEEGGREVLVRCDRTGEIRDLTPAPLNVRTRAHEYGGGAYTVHEGTVYFSNFSDQHLYRQPEGGDPVPLYTAPGMRYADAVADPARGRLICVREDHSIPGREAVNTLISLDLDGKRERVLSEGSDFYSSPRVSPDGTRLAWLSWNHPNMPWDGTDLFVADFAPDGSLANVRRASGGKEESIFQPEWSPGGELYFVSDRTGWWNLYRLRGESIEALAEREAEFGVPQWVFGQTTYAFFSPDHVACAYTRDGKWELAVLDVRTKDFRPVGLPFTNLGGVQAGDGFVALLAGSPSEPWTVVRIDSASLVEGPVRLEVLRRSLEAEGDLGQLSVPESIYFPTEGGRSAHGFFYRPVHPDYEPPEGERPPLLVVSHGGPTSSASSTLNLEIQYWTSRGFAVLDVNYGGSTGFGRPYRERLKGNWGIVDVDDCVNGARFLADRGLVDSKRLAIRGGSAGGYTTLASLAFRDVFQAGASHYGVSDLELLVKDTHKFESRYLEGLIGPYPGRLDLYTQRSPIYHLEGLTRPVIFFQGTDDRVVPPNQAELMVDALRKKQVPVAYVLFEGEGHGFRRSENIRRALEAELYFYGAVFGFAPSGPIEPVRIENL